MASLDRKKIVASLLVLVTSWVNADTLSKAAEGKQNGPTERMENPIEVQESLPNFAVMSTRPGERNAAVNRGRILFAEQLLNNILQIIPVAYPPVDFDGQPEPPPQNQQFPRNPGPGPGFPAPQFPGPQFPGPQFPGPQFPGPQFPGPQSPQNPGKPENPRGMGMGMRMRNNMGRKPRPQNPPVSNKPPQRTRPPVRRVPLTFAPVVPQPTFFPFSEPTQSPIAPTPVPTRSPVAPVPAPPVTPPTAPTPTAPTGGMTPVPVAAPVAPPTPFPTRSRPTGPSVVTNPYRITYTISSTDTPSTSDTAELAAITDFFVDGFFQIAFTQFPVFSYVSASTSNTINSAFEIDYVTTTFFADGSTLLPGQSDIQQGVQIAFTDQVMEYFNVLQTELSANNPYRTTTAVTYAEIA